MTSFLSHISKKPQFQKSFSSSVKNREECFSRRVKGQVSFSYSGRSYDPCALILQKMTQILSTRGLLTIRAALVSGHSSPRKIKFTWLSHVAASAGGSTERQRKSLAFLLLSFLKDLSFSSDWGCVGNTWHTQITRRGTAQFQSKKEKKSCSFNYTVLHCSQHAAPVSNSSPNNCVQ